jgi:hypothetical protein
MVLVSMNEYVPEAGIDGFVDAWTATVALGGPTSGRYSLKYYR